MTTDAAIDDVPPFVPVGQTLVIVGRAIRTNQMIGWRRRSIMAFQARLPFDVVCYRPGS
jgi:hypothetical protein